MGERLYAGGLTSISGYHLFDDRGKLRLLPQSPFEGVASAYGLGLDLSDDFLYAANNSGNSVSGFRIDRKSGDLIPLADSPFVSGKNPTSVTVVNNLQ